MEQLTLEYAKHLKNLVRQAEKADPQYQVFGASSHRYQLYPVLSVQAVEAYEAKYNIQLPSEYKFFITHVGNGGAGPDYGIGPLDLTKPRTQEMMELPLITSQLTQSQWEEALQQDTGDCLRGTYVFGSKGCTFANLIVANGPEENRVFYINFEWDEEDPPYDTGMNFLTWYEGFFQEIVNGNNVTIYGYHALGSEQQLMNEFYETTDKERQRKLLDSLFRFDELSPQACSFLRALSEEDFAGEKLSLMLHYLPQEGVFLLERLLKTDPHIAIRELSQVPQDQLPRFYDSLRELLYTIENGSEGYPSARETILYAMGRCPQLSAEDLVEFLNQEGITDQEKWTVFIVLGDARDKKRYLDLFIHAMQTESSRIARAAAEAVETVCSPKLQSVLPELWERYQDESAMKFHLERAFESNGMKLPKKKEIKTKKKKRM